MAWNGIELSGVEWNGIEWKTMKWKSTWKRKWIWKWNEIPQLLNFLANRGLATVWWIVWTSCQIEAGTRWFHTDPLTQLQNVAVIHCWASSCWHAVVYMMWKHGSLLKRSFVRKHPKDDNDGILWWCQWVYQKDGIWIFPWLLIFMGSCDGCPSWTNAQDIMAT